MKHMRRILLAMLLSIFAVACAPKIGSKEWCEDMKEKPKGDWTASEAGAYAKHCIFSDGEES
ncbi:MAG: DUF3012 domain-containing protein [Aestuariibacter sp.]